MSLLPVIFLMSLSSSHADDSNWLAKTQAFDCWRMLGDQDQNPMGRTSEYQANGTIIEVPVGVSTDVVAIVHTTEGTISVGKNGGCTKAASPTTESFIGGRLEKLAAEMTSYKRSGDGYTRVIPATAGSGGGNSSMRSDHYLSQMQKTHKLLGTCSSVKGPVGDGARNGLSYFSTTARPEAGVEIGR